MKLPTKSGIRSVTRYLEPLRSVCSIEWQKQSGGLAYPVYDGTVCGLLDALHDNGFVQPAAFDYHRWYNDTGQRYVEDSGLLKNADLETCVKLLTVSARAERFCDGWVARMIENQHISRVLERLSELAL
jgi:hypothetical protein